MTKKYFKEQTIKELKALKKYATKKELSKLDFITFHPGKNKSCLYGQMTGHCRNKRAMNLIDKCCDFKLDESLLNSVIEKRIPIDGGPRMGTKLYYSFLEIHIMKYRNHNKNILAWLKGETSKFPIGLS